MSGWETGALTLDYPMALPVAATARWTGDRTLSAAICYLNPASTRTFKMRFAGDTAEVRTFLTGTFAPPEELVLTARST